MRGHLLLVPNIPLGTFKLRQRYSTWHLQSIFQRGFPWQYLYGLCFWFTADEVTNFRDRDLLVNTDALSGQSRKRWNLGKWRASNKSDHFYTRGRNNWLHYHYCSYRMWSGGLCQKKVQKGGPWNFQWDDRWICFSWERVGVDHYRSSERERWLVWYVQGSDLFHRHLWNPYFVFH